MNMRDEFSNVTLFHLVESRDFLNDRRGFKHELKEDEIFETQFISASERDCQS